MAYIQRSSFIFLTGLLIASGTAIGTELMVGQNEINSRENLDYNSPELIPIVPQRELTASDNKALKVAWRYIEQNTRNETGLVDSVAGFPSTTMWDQGSYIFALIGAKKIGLISELEFASRIERLLSSLEVLPLFDGKLPNKAYDTRTLEMVNYQNEVSDEGIGWSALDICRTLMALKALEREAPAHSKSVRQIVRKWDFTNMATAGELWGAAIIDGEIKYLQEGRLGYEQYAARAAALWGLDVFEATSAKRSLDWVTVEGVELPTDTRVSQSFDAISPILSEPYLLQVFEMGWDRETHLFASHVFAAQENRYRSTGQFTAVSEDHINQDPFFLYSSVYSDGEEWAVVTEDGTSYTQFRTVSTKAAFGWDAVFNTNYTRDLVDHVAETANPDYGWAAGIFESDGELNSVYALNTNAVVIEAIHFKVLGPMWRY